MLIAAARHLPEARLGGRPKPAAAVRAFEPERLDPRVVAALNRLCRRRRGISVSLEGAPLELCPTPRPILTPDAPTQGAGETLDLVFALAPGGTAVLTLPRPVVRQVVARLDAGLTELPGEPTLSLLVELALAPLLDALERLAAMSLTLVGIRATPRRLPAGDIPALAFAGTYDGVPLRAHLRVGRGGAGLGALEHLARALESSAAAFDPAAAPRDLPILLEVRAGALRLPVATLAALRPGDVLVPDVFPYAQGRMAVVAGGRSAAALADAAGVRLTTPLRPIRTDPMESVMTAPGERADPVATSSDSALGDLEVAVSFELGRCQIDLETLRTLAPGYVFPLPADPAGPVDILANGRRIGRGEIVRVGETLGVRATRLFGHE